MKPSDSPEYGAIIREHAAAHAAQSAREQGLPTTVTDPAVIQLIASMLRHPRYGE